MCINKSFPENIYQHIFKGTLAKAAKRVGFRYCSQKGGLFRNYPHDQIILNIDGSGVCDKWHKLQVSKTIVRPWCESELFNEKAK